MPNKKLNDIHKSSMRELVSFSPLAYMNDVCEAAMRENTVTLIPGRFFHSHFVFALLCEIYACKFHPANIIYVTTEAELVNERFRYIDQKQFNLTIVTPDEIQWHTIDIANLHLVVFDEIQLLESGKKGLTEFKAAYNRLNKSAYRPRVFGMFIGCESRMGPSSSNDWTDRLSGSDMAYRVLKLAERLECSVFVGDSHSPADDPGNQFYAKCLAAFSSVSRRQPPITNNQQQSYHQVKSTTLFKQPDSKRVGSVVSLYLHSNTPLAVLDRIVKDKRQDVSTCHDTLFDNNVKIVNYHLNGEISIVSEILKYAKSINQSVSVFNSDWNWDTTTDNCKIGFQFIEFGNLLTNVDFCPGNARIDSSKSNLLEVNHDRQEIKIVHGYSRQEVVIQFDSIDKMICIDPVPTSTLNHVDIYVPLKRMPLFYKQIDKGQKKRVIPVDKLQTLVETHCLTLKIRMNNGGANKIIPSIGSIDGVKVFMSFMKQTPFVYGVNQLRDDFAKLKPDFEWQYALECFFSQCTYAVYGKLTPSFLKVLVNSKLALSSLENFEMFIELLIPKMKQMRYFSMNKIIESALDELKKHADDTIISCINKFDPNQKIQKIRTVVVTPTRFIFELPSLTCSNRLTREYTPEKFLRVRFRDENRDKLHSSHWSDQEILFERVLSILKRGFRLKGRHYDFLASSNSQLRDHGVWMFWNDGKVDAEMVRQQMGDFSMINNVGKYAARLGQALAASLPTIEIDKRRMRHVPDVTDSHDRFTFTDGIGMISQEKALEIRTKYFGGRNISAFQIRMGGYKGVVTVAESVINMVYDLFLRESMKKFDSDHNVIEVLNESQYQPCFLNRQIIMILSCLGIRDKVFMDLQKKSLNENRLMLIDNEKAARRLKKTLGPSVFPDDYFSTTSSALFHDLNSDRFFRSILERLYSRSMSGLISKSKVFVPKGRLLMGCIDETNSLKHDQVFVQLSRQPDEEFTLAEAKYNQDTDSLVVLTSQCIVAKNPCMHPGDIRKLNAVYSPNLLHLVDVVVFPCVGTRPVTNMCSGSDLDGDLYWISWDSSLVPVRTHKPMRYDAAEPSSGNRNKHITISDVAKFTVDFMQNDNLGVISNLHMKLADQSPDGVADPNCVELAELFSQAVDFPKTGKVVEIPDSIRSDASSRGYPDFMEKTSQRSYQSDKIIGKMYRECKLEHDANLFKSTKGNNDIEPSLLMSGYKEYIDEARIVYELYCDKIEFLINKWECDDEIDLFVEKERDKHETWDDVHAKFKLIKTQVKNLWDKMRSDFFFAKDSQGDKLCKTDLMKRASAWYYVAYKSQREERKCLSFAWIAAKQLWSVYQFNSSSYR